MTTVVKTPIWFWLLGIVFLVWNLFGVMNYLSGVMATPEGLATQGYTEDQIAFLLDAPSYYMTIFALAVWPGLIGAILFLLRKSWATKVFLFSLVFILLSLIIDFIGGTFAVLGGAYLGIMIFVTIMGFVQYFVSRNLASKGILH
ncbi:hypothetical protein [Litorimonas haliclonae]|uniref:hypothetical protein n=1 Tax=Litorimonas haliclonae TaxID=2081977 RepID=UPI0039EFCF6D